MNRFASSHSRAVRPNRATRRFVSSALRRAAPRGRRGQALILAVLIMLMIALVAAGFLVVVSGNLNQTARVTDKSRAVEAARSGLRFVNEQLTYSKLGEVWRPGFVPVSAASLTPAEKERLNQGESAIPKPSDAPFNLYYTPVDRANGWAGTFAKFPDPLAPRSDAPTFLARVQRIPGELDAGDPDATDAAKQGALKITVIGLSPDDPAAFHKSIAYKGGQNAPLGRVMRAVSNWDFKNKVVPGGSANYDNTTQILTLQNVKGAFPPVPFSLVIGDAASADLSGAVVDSVPTTGQLHISSDPFGKKLTNVRVELAAQLGSSLPLGVAGSDSAVDFNLDGAIAGDGSENTSLLVSNPTSAGSARVNGGLSLLGGVSLPDLDASSGETVRVSGLMVQPALTANSKATVSTGAAPTTPVDLASGSNAANFPGAGVSLDLVSDGADRLANNPGGDRDVAPFSPPDFASGAGVKRFRELTRDSKSLVSSQPDAANFGFGEGLYINNPSDRERVFDGAKLRDMTQAELVQMWLSRDAAGNPNASRDFNRTATPLSPTLTGASLEQQHLRGWVGPDEFRARGALVELFNDATDGGKAKIAVTLDARSDNSAAGPNNAFGPVDAKAWRDASGAPQSGVFRRVFQWPANGVVFAEGNVRVRGTIRDSLGAAPRSLTVVSQNNVYVDGSLGAGAKKVLLLARKNVVANPTAAIFRPDAQTVAASAQTLAIGAATDVAVADSSEFRVGDVVESAAPSAPTATKIVAVVANVPDANTLRISSLAGTTLDAGDAIRTRADAVQNARPILSSPTDAIQRRVQVSDASNLRLALTHNADRVAALTVETEDASGFSKPASPFVRLSNNKAATGAISPAEKKLQGDFTSPTPGNDPFPAAPHSTETAANTFDLAAIKAAMEGTTHVADPVGWKYKVTLAAPSPVPAFYMAGVGGRGDFGATVPAGTPDFRKDISNSFYEIPLATSVLTIFNGAPAALSGFDASPGTATHFGFDPLYTTTSEDVSTNDQSFYQGTSASGTPDAATNNATLDSRLLTGATAGENSLVLRPDAGIVAGTTLPTYRAGTLKLESVDATGAVAPGYTMNISAFVYAQTGSWFVIPAAPANPIVDNSKLRGDEQKSYFDFNANNLADAGEYVDADTSGTFSAGDAADLNRNGAADTGESSAYLRFARANYRINFVGAIAENQTALVNSAGANPGAVQAWSNSWASYNASGGALSNRIAGVDYTFDPAYANGSLLNDDGFRMPQSPELTYVD